MNVHLLEPDLRLRRRLRHFLERHGIEVTEASDMSGTRATCAVKPPTAVVTELVLEPPALVERLRHLVPDAPILVWTRPDRPGLAGTVRKLGCGFVAKPALSAEVAFELGRLAATWTPGASLRHRAAPPAPARERRA